MEDSRLKGVSACEDDCNGVDWGSLVPWLLWALSGFSGLGSIAGSVRNPTTNFTVAALLLLLYSVLIGIIPYIGALSFHSDQSDYQGAFLDLMWPHCTLSGVFPHYL